jgi:hypothetical protein
MRVAYSIRNATHINSEYVILSALSTTAMITRTGLNITLYLRSLSFISYVRHEGVFGILGITQLTPVFSTLNCCL